MTDPRLLLIDFTAITGSAATSTLKATYFRDWRDDALLHVMDIGNGKLGAASGCAPPREILTEPDCAGHLVEAFMPQLILYRPVADSPALHAFAMAAIQAGQKLGARLALWMMDDWPARLEHTDPQRQHALDTDLRNLFSRSSLNLAISSGMADAFSRRYGVGFEVVHNGIVPEEWLSCKKPARDDVIVRYAGSLAPDTTRASVMSVAKAVSSLAKNSVPIRFEGRTHDVWLQESGAAMNELDAVSFVSSELDDAAYRNWLAEADILLVCYNFDDITRAYLRYSFANKLPETMAAGAAILAYGPTELETLNYLKRSEAALMVCEPDDAVLADAIKSLAKDRKKRSALGSEARRYAFEHFNLPAMRARFRMLLHDAASPPRRAREEPSETDKIQLDECRVVFEVLGASDNRGVMVDVGAHTGGSLLPYAKAGWRIIAFEPDRKNRKALTAAVSKMDNVSVDARAVGAKIENGLAFFRSKVSTGISGLSPFHESHYKAGSVDMTTLDALIAETNLKEIDFLKIDVEGHEMAVLDGLDFSKLRPRAILAEFEDSKTVANGYTYHDLAQRLQGAGYHVYVSEWHPIETYGQKHSWRRMRTYPCDIAEEAWGNLIGLLEPVEDDAMAAAIYAAQTGGPAGGGAQASISEIASPIPKSTSYQKLALATIRYAPGLATFLRPLARRIRGVAR